MFRSSSSSNGFMDNIPPLTKHILIINVICFIAAFSLPRIGVDVYQILGLHYWKGTDFHFYQLITYMFMHSGIGHIFFNMFAVYMFGQVIERYYGSRFYMLFFFLTGLGAGIVQEFAWMYDLRPAIEEYHSYLNNFPAGGIDVGNKVVHSIDELTVWFHTDFCNRMVTVGASGAVFGLLIAFAISFPDAPLYIMFIPIPIKAKYMMIGYAVLELFLGVQNFTGDNVAHFAHLGGALFGAVLIIYYRKSRIINRK